MLEESIFAISDLKRFSPKDTSLKRFLRTRKQLCSDGINESKLTTKWLSILAQELELLEFVDMLQKGRGRGRGVDFYIYPTGSVERKALLDALKE